MYLKKLMNMILSFFILFFLNGCFSIQENIYISEKIKTKRVYIDNNVGKNVSAYLFRPNISGKRPAVVMLHGCAGLISKKDGGLKPREKAWRDIFLEEGYVVLLVDSFTDRGYRSICKIPLTNRPIEPNQERPRDAYGALQWLQRQSFVAPGKIAIGGWSNGAMSLLWTGLDSAPQRPKGLTHDFRVAFGFYPGCITLGREKPGYKSSVPTMLQLGGDDNWTWPRPCQRLAEIANRIGSAPIAVITHQGAVHSFDHPSSARRVISTSGGRQVRIGTNTQARDKSIKQIKLLLKNSFE